MSKYTTNYVCRIHRLQWQQENVTDCFDCSPKNFVGSVFSADLATQNGRKFDDESTDFDNDFLVLQLLYCIETYGNDYLYLFVSIHCYSLFITIEFGSKLDVQQGRKQIMMHFQWMILSALQCRICG